MLILNYILLKGNEITNVTHTKKTPVNFINVERNDIHSKDVNSHTFETKPKTVFYHNTTIPSDKQLSLYRTLVRDLELYHVKIYPPKNQELFCKYLAR